MGVEGIGGGFLRFSAGAVVMGREGSIRCDGIGLPTSTAYWRASREEGCVLSQIRPVQMARMIGKVGVVLRSSEEQAIPRVRPVVAFGFEYSTMPGWGRSMWYGRCTLGGRGGVPVPRVCCPRLAWVFGGVEGVCVSWMGEGGCGWCSFLVGGCFSGCIFLIG